MSLGSYLHREAGLGMAPGGAVELDAGGHFAVETLLSALRSEWNGAPLGLVAAWARRRGDGPWQEASPQDPAAVLYPVHARTLDYVVQNAYGHEVPYLAVLSRRVIPEADIEHAFGGTPVNPTETEAVFDPGAGPSPRIRFLYWIQLHDGVGGGRESPLSAAEKLGAILVFPLPIDPLPGQELPPLPFETALALQDAAARSGSSYVPAAPVGDAGASPATIGAVVGWTAALGGLAYILGSMWNMKAR